MSPIRVGIDLGPSPIRVGALILGKYIVVQGTKAIRVHGPDAPKRHDVVEIFKDVNQVTKSFFGAPNFQAAVVVVPNGTSLENQEAIRNAGASYNIMEIITENTAVAIAYAEKVKPTGAKRLAIVSITAGVFDVSIFGIFSDEQIDLEAQETHTEPIEFEQHHAQDHSSHSGPGGLLGLVGGAIGGAVKTLVVDPLDKAFDIVKKLLSNPKLTKSVVDVVVFVGKASKSEKLKHAVKERFPTASVWSPEDIEAEELAAFGAGVIAYKQLTKQKRNPLVFRVSDEDSESRRVDFEEQLKAAEENLPDEPPEEDYGEDEEKIPGFDISKASVSL